MKRGSLGRTPGVRELRLGKHGRKGGETRLERSVDLDTGPVHQGSANCPPTSRLWPTACVSMAHKLRMFLQFQMVKEH